MFVILIRSDGQIQPIRDNKSCSPGRWIWSRQGDWGEALDCEKQLGRRMGRGWFLSYPTRNRQCSIESIAEAVEPVMN